MKTIAIDFDGVIHKYSKGWQDGSIYDKPIEGAFKYIEKLMDEGYAVFILSTRSPRQIKKWIDNQNTEYFYDNEFSLYNFSLYNFKTSLVPFWTKFWDKPRVLGITQRKLPAIAYIDDRAIKFEGDFNSLKI